jgi:nitrate reductase assembly molybdenum cofactor insertion protein NarJ
MNAATDPAVVADERVLDLLLWSRFFSPLVDDDDRARIYAALGLGDFAAVADDYWGTFHAGAPQTPVCLLLHAALQQDGGDLREDLVRVMEHLQLDWAGAPLPPDHAAAMLELLAIAHRDEEPVLQRELRRRWLLPWAAQTDRLPEGSPWLAVMARLAADLVETAAA